MSDSDEVLREIERLERLALETIGYAEHASLVRQLARIAREQHERANLEAEKAGDMFATAHEHMITANDLRERAEKAEAERDKLLISGGQIMDSIKADNVRLSEVLEAIDAWIESGMVSKALSEIRAALRGKE